MTATYRRKAFPNRPWIHGSLYDLLARDNVVHCDARLVHVDRLARDVLLLDWRRGGHTRIAADAYMVEPDGLTPLWEPDWTGRAVYWTPATNAFMARLHRTVMNEVERAQDAPGVERVSFLAHYVPVKDKPAFPYRNHWKPPVRRSGSVHGNNT